MPVNHATSSSWTPEQAERVSDAKRLLEQKGLQVPAVTIEFHASENGCAGNLGYFRPYQNRIDICTDLRFVLVHELAHSWVHHNLDEAAKQKFVKRNQLRSWNDKQDDWDERGTELAAFTIQQVAMRKVDRINQRAETLLDNFGYLTSQELSWPA